jgi:hypothetical protein
MAGRANFQVSGRFGVVVSDKNTRGRNPMEIYFYLDCGLYKR